MHYTSNVVDLEEKLKVRSVMDRLEERFDEFSKKELRTDMPERSLRKIKVFLYEKWSSYKNVIKGSILDSKDCITLTAIASMLATRKGIKNTIASPRKLNRLMHAMLVYFTQGDKKVFEFTSKQRYKNYRILGVSEIRNRILYTRYLFPFVYLIRQKNHADYLK